MTDTEIAKMEAAFHRIREIDDGAQPIIDVLFRARAVLARMPVVDTDLWREVDRGLRAGWRIYCVRNEAAEAFARRLEELGEEA